MREIRKGPLSDFLLGRTSLIELMLVAIFISFGVSTIAGSITLFKWFNPEYGILIGVVLCILSLIYLFFRAFGNRTKNQRFDGFFVYSKKDNTLVEIPRYRFADSVRDDLNSAFAENSALKLIWDKEPINTFLSYDKKKKQWVKKEPRAAKLLKEAVEYYLLEKLSIHLTDYYNNGNFREKDIYEFQRSQIPDVLLSNRFLELFSKSMDERPMFAERNINDNNFIGETVMAFGKNGATYQKFDLVLPRKSKVTRIKENQIEIKTRRFTMVLSVDFDGTNTVLPRGFEKYYLLRERFDDASAYKVHIDVSIKFNLFSIFSMRSWGHYKWVDSFLKVLDESISQEKFFEMINWENVLTLIHCSNIYSKGMQETAVIEKIID
jgi:hypothetical protein